MIRWNISKYSVTPPESVTHPNIHSKQSLIPTGTNLHRLNPLTSEKSNYACKKGAGYHRPQPGSHKNKSIDFREVQLCLNEKSWILPTPVGVAQYLFCKILNISLFIRFIKKIKNIFIFKFNIIIFQ